MQITSIEKAKHKGYNLFVEHQFALCLSSEALSESGVKVGQQITPQKLSEIKKAADLLSAREKALNLLENRSHSEKELYDKLCRVFSPEIAEDVTSHMVELGLVDDASYARRLALSLWSDKGYGPYRIRQYLSQKGFSPELIGEVLDEMSDKIEEESVGKIEDIIRRKYVKYLSGGDNGAKNKVVNGLMRLGYGYDEIKTALKNFDEAED